MAASDFLPADLAIPNICTVFGRIKVFGWVLDKTLTYLYRKSSNKRRRCHSFSAGSLPLRHAQCVCAAGDGNAMRLDFNDFSRARKARMKGRRLRRPEFDWHIGPQCMYARHRVKSADLTGKRIRWTAPINRRFFFTDFRRIAPAFSGLQYFWQNAVFLKRFKRIHNLLRA